MYLAFVKERAAIGLIKRPDIIEGNLNVLLRFFGPAPATPEELPLEYETPYHDYRLADPIDDPSILRAFEAWLAARQVAPSTRNHYLNTVSRMYWLATHPEFRAQAPGVGYNPFSHRPRSPWRRRTAIVSVDGLKRWLQHASYHARLAIAIAALAPKLRLTNILELEWGTHVDLERRVITGTRTRRTSAARRS